MRYYVAQDTFSADLADGTPRFVTRGEPLPESHELVRRDLDASRRNASRTPLFKPLDSADDDEPQPRRLRRAGG